VAVAVAATMAAAETLAEDRPAAIVAALAAAAPAVEHRAILTTTFHFDRNRMISKARKQRVCGPLHFNCYRHATGYGAGNLNGSGEHDLGK